VVNVSVLCPSRGRGASLAKSAETLTALAADPSMIEILVAVDPDDEATAQAASFIPARVKVWRAPQRYGYARLHEYYNALARMACGRWLLIWNDDARMLTQGWDAVIAAQQPGVLWSQANHCGGGNLFPAWPREWTQALGHVSLSPHCDMWIQHIGQGLGCQRRIPVEVFHDRKDVTGGHDDATYAEGRGLIGPDDTIEPFPYERVREDAEIIRRLGADIERTIKERA